MRIKLVLALAVLSCGLLMVAGCEKADETTTAPPAVSSQARPDAPNPNKTQRMQPAAGAMQEMK